MAKTDFRNRLIDCKNNGKYLKCMYRTKTKTRRNSRISMNDFSAYFVKIGKVAYEQITGFTTQQNTGKIRPPTNSFTPQSAKV